MERLTRRQREVLNVILRAIKKEGHPPSIRAIAESLSISSPTGVVRHLEKLERKGYIRRTPEARVIQILGPSRGGWQEAGVVYLPVIGRVAAGTPLLAEENVTGYEPVSKRLIRRRDAFLLQVRGDSMKDAHILDGDHVIVEPAATAENGEIVVALVGDEATVKRFYRRQGYIELRPENSRYEPQRYREGVVIQGKVVGVQRRIKP